MSLRKALEAKQSKALEGDIEPEASDASPASAPNAAPEGIPPDVWHMIQSNGRKATEHLHSLLHSARFARLPVNAQAKLIGLAQDRAFGKVASAPKRIEARIVTMTDETAAALATAAARARLPEFRGGTSPEPTSTSDGPPTASPATAPDA